VSLSMGVGALAPTPIRSPEGMEPSLGRPSSLHKRYRLSIRVAPYSKGNLSIPLKYIDTITTLIHLLMYPSLSTLS